jgi:hypothetical protein
MRPRSHPAHTSWPAQWVVTAHATQCFTSLCECLRKKPHWLPDRACLPWPTTHEAGVPDLFLTAPWLLHPCLWTQPRPSSAAVPQAASRGGSR